MDNKKFLFEEDSVWHALAVMALPAIARKITRELSMDFGKQMSVLL